MKDTVAQYLGTTQEVEQAVEMAIAPWAARYAYGRHPFPLRSFAYISSTSPESDLYIFSGENQSGIQEALYQLNTQTLKLESIETAGANPPPRIDARAVSVATAIIVFGGHLQTGRDNELYVFNTINKTWTIAAVPGGKPVSRGGHSMTLVGTQLIVFGGRGTDGTVYNDLLTYNIETLFSFSSAWQEVTSNRANRAPPRVNHTAVMNDNKLYIFGGQAGKHTYDDLWEFDPAIESWTRVECFGFLPGPRHSHAAVVVDGIMYVAGGVDEKGQYSSEMYAYRFASRYWHRIDATQAKPPARASHALCAVGSRLFMIGGEIRQPLATDPAIYICSTDSIHFPAERQGWKQEYSESVRLWTTTRRGSTTRSAHSRSTSKSIGTIRNDLSKDIMRTLPKEQQPDALSRVLNNYAQDDFKRSLTSKDFAALEEASGHARSNRRATIPATQRLQEEDQSAFHTVDVQTFSAVEKSSTKPRREDKRYLLPAIETASPMIPQGEANDTKPLQDRQELLDALGIQRTGTSPVQETQHSEEHAELEEPLQIGADKRMPDASFLLHALQVLRTEHQRQRKILIGERDAALQAASEQQKKMQQEREEEMNVVRQRARVQSNREVQTARAQLLSEHQEKYNALRHLEEQQRIELANQNADLVRELEAQRTSVGTSQAELEKLKTVLQEKESALAKFAQLEKQHGELADRQSHQLSMISQLTGTISSAQRRAEEAERHARTEAERALKLEQDLIKMTARMEEMQSQTDHYRKLSSLATFNAEHNATEVENTRQILFNGLHQLLGSDAPGSESAQAHALNRLTPVRVQGPMDVSLGQSSAS